MIVALAWVAIAAAAVAVEVTARHSGYAASLGELGRRVASCRIGRLILFACWVFIGWHLFARYSVPPL